MNDNDNTKTPLMTACTWEFVSEKDKQNKWVT